MSELISALALYTGAGLVMGAAVGAVVVACVGLREARERSESSVVRERRRVVEWMRGEADNSRRVADAGLSSADRDRYAADVVSDLAESVWECEHHGR